MILMAFLIAASSAFFVYTFYNSLYYKYNLLIPGMAVSEAESVLGPGRRMGRERVPWTRLGPVVDGEKFYSWKDEDAGEEIWIGAVDGTIHGKWYWSRSF